jgi:hypothetical protein
MLTGFTDDDRAALEATLRVAGGRIVDVAREQGAGLVIVESDSESLFYDLHRLVANRKLVLLAEACAEDMPIRITEKVLFGLAYGCVPLRPSWAHASLMQNCWQPVPGEYAAKLANTNASAAAGRGGGPRSRSGDASPDRARAQAWTPLLSGYVIVPTGSDDFCAKWTPLLRAAGAEVRTDLPPQHHGARDHVSQRCLVLVEKDADEAAVRTRLERARAREVIAISQDWAKHCLLQQRVLPPTDFIFKPSSKR